jgi:hypothetical protein
LAGVQNRLRGLYLRQFLLHGTAIYPKIAKICPRRAEFSRRLPKTDRLLAGKRLDKSHQVAVRVTDGNKAQEMSRCLRRRDIDMPALQLA